MGSDRAKLFTRCCYAAVSLIALCAMFWIAWCLFGLTAVQVSEAQRRAVVHYSPAPRPPTTPTTPATEETSAANAISRSPTTVSLQPKRKELAKGDFSPRDRGAHNATADVSKPPQGPPAKGSEEEDRVHARRVLSPGAENRPQEKEERRKPAEPTLDIAPTRVHDAEIESRVQASRDQTDELPRRDDVQGSQRSEHEPEFEREEPRRPFSPSDRGRPGNRDEPEDERGSRRRYDAGRGGDDRYSKGDTRVYPDDPPADRLGEGGRRRHPEDRVRKGDDDEDRYRYRDDRRRPSDRDREDRPPARDERYRDEERYRSRYDDRNRDRDDERYRSRYDDRNRDRDDERYRPRDDRYRDDDRYRGRDEDRYRYRDDDRYPVRDGDRHIPRDDEKYRHRDDRYWYRDDERYRPPDDDERKFRDDDEKDAGRRYRVREDDRYSPRDDERHRTGSADSPRRPSDDRDSPRTGDEKYVDATGDRESPSRGSGDLPVGERKSSSRYEHNTRGEETVTDYDIPVRETSRSREEAPRLPRPTYYDEEEIYRERGRDDDRRRPSKTEISPTRTREESSLSRSVLIDSRSKGSGDDQRDRPRDDDRYDTDERRNTGIKDSRSSFANGESSRRYIDDRDKYQTRLPGGDSRQSDRREEVVLDRRSYASEDEYRKDSRRGSYDRDRRPIDETRKYGNDEGYSRRDQVDDDGYKSRIPSDYDRDRSKTRDRYDDDYRRYEDRYDDRNVRRYDTYPEGERPRRRDPDLSKVRLESSRDREEDLRPSSTRDEERSYSRREYIHSKPPSLRPYDDDIDSRDTYPEGQRYSERPRRPSSTKEATIGTAFYSREPSDEVVREKRFGDDSGKAQIHPLSAKDVIEAANRQSEASDSNARKVYYPVFDPRLSNLTAPEIIRPGERRGTTITVRKRRSA